MAPMMTRRATNFAIRGTSETKTSPDRYSPIAVIGYFLFVLAFVWLPSLVHRGYVFTRDPSFFAATRADIGWSLGTFSFLGGTSTISNQGLFYEPYAVLSFFLHAAGIGAAGISKVIPLLVSAVALAGVFALLRDLALNTASSLLGATFFLVNPWSLDQFGYFYIWSGYCMLPLVVLATRRIIRGERTPIWYPISLVFLGGVVAWLVAFVVLTLTVLSIGRHTVSPFGLRRLQPFLWFLVATLYWLPAYLFWVLLQGTGALAYSSSGGPLQTGSPLANLLELRDFWWPHLSPLVAVGHAAAAAATVASACIVGVAAWRIADDFAAAGTHYGSRDSGVLTDVGVFAVLGAVGLILGEGTSGIFGPLYSWLHNSSLPGHLFIASLTRDPSNLAGPFVFAIAVGLSAAVEPRRTGLPTNCEDGGRQSGIRSAVRLGILAVMALGPGSK